MTVYPMPNTTHPLASREDKGQSLRRSTTTWQASEFLIWYSVDLADFPSSMSCLVAKPVSNELHVLYTSKINNLRKDYPERYAAKWIHPFLCELYSITFPS